MLFGTLQLIITFTKIYKTQKFKMKKSLLILGLALALFSCNKEEGPAASAEFKTAYVDTDKLSKEYEAFKDLESQGKVRQEQLGRQVEETEMKLRQDYAAAEGEARAKGPQWAQLKAQELQKRAQELEAMKQKLANEFSSEFGDRNDSVVSKMKKYIRDYGKKKGYDYIFTTADVSSIMYAKDGYNITDEILKALNEEYKSTSKKEEATEEKK